MATLILRPTSYTSASPFFDPPTPAEMADNSDATFGTAAWASQGHAQFGFPFPSLPSPATRVRAGVRYLNSSSGNGFLVELYRNGVGLTGSGAYMNGTAIATSFAPWITDVADLNTMQVRVSHVSYNSDGAASYLYEVYLEIEYGKGGSRMMA